jgi:hypothetical protein
MRRSSRWCAAAAVTALAATLSGCLSVPHSGRVAGPVAGALGAAPNVAHEARIEPAPRASGAKPDAVIRGFYDAMVDYTQDHSIAKTYLTDGAWRETPARVVIVDGPVLPNPVATSARSTTYELPFTKVGEVLADHEFIAAPAGEKFVDKVTVTRGDDGQWRISTPPPDLRLSIEDFTTDFRSASLYFPLTGGDGTLVADPRWFPTRSADLPAQIVQAYAAGPSDFLAADARVLRLLPSGTVASADVLNDPAQLTFAVAGGDMPTPAQQNELATALSRTFQPLTSTIGVSQLYMAFGNGSRIQLSLAAPPQPAALATVKSSWFVTQTGQLRPWTEPADTGAPPAGPVAFDVRGMRTVSLSPGIEPTFAAGAVKTTAGVQVKLVDRGHWSRLVTLDAESVTGVTWSADGSALWIAGQRNGMPAVWYLGGIQGQVSASTSSYFVPSAAQQVELDPTLLASGGVVQEVRPSPDGIRISALVSRKGEGSSTLYVARIDMSGERPAIVSSRVINTALVPTRRPGLDVSHAWWTSDQKLVVVARQVSATGEFGEYSVWDVNSIDGSDVQLRNTSGLPNIGNQKLAGAPGADMLALDGKGVVWELTGATWRSQRKRADGAKVVQILYPG